MYDIIGDIHSCHDEFVELLIKLGYQWVPAWFSMSHPKGRKVILVGDIIDRGWFPSSVFQLVENMIKDKSLLMVKGNHDDKLQRWAKGNDVKLLHGLDITAERLLKAGISREEIINFYSKIPYFLTLDGNKLVVVHAAWKDEYVGRDPFDKRVRSWCIFGPTSGQLDDGMPNRIDWAINRQREMPIVVHGHQPMKEVRVINGVWNIDTGCTFGGSLTALRYPEMTTVSVSAFRIYCRRESRWGYGEKI
jgi:protein phosphatase